ncbi:hypothetical protein PG991_008375 [Apiospora marii]|uniref:Uncharacterized protein n=1 Tax=Apiospora marii TaxID=335849 RepID=A0ABR1RL15_9PEZI
MGIAPAAPAAAVRDAVDGPEAVLGGLPPGRLDHAVVAGAVDGELPGQVPRGRLLARVLAHDLAHVRVVQVVPQAAADAGDVAHAVGLDGEVAEVVLGDLVAGAGVGGGGQEAGGQGVEAEGGEGLRCGDSLMMAFSGEWSCVMMMEQVLMV